MEKKQCLWFSDSIDLIENGIGDAVEQFKGNSKNPFFKLYLDTQLYQYLVLEPQTKREFVEIARFWAAIIGKTQNFAKKIR